MSTTENNHRPTKHEGQFDITPMQVIKKSVVTVGIDADGKKYLIGPDGTVFDPVKMPRASDKINSGTVTTVNSIAKFATGGCPIEVKGNLPEGPYCYVINDVTGELLGACPKEQYICKD